MDLVETWTKHQSEHKRFSSKSCHFQGLSLHCSVLDLSVSPTYFTVTSRVLPQIYFEMLFSFCGKSSSQTSPVTNESITSANKYLSLCRRKGPRANNFLSPFRDFPIDEILGQTVYLPNGLIVILRKHSGYSMRGLLMHSAASGRVYQIYLCVSMFLDKIFLTSFVVLLGPP